MWTKSIIAGAPAGQAAAAFGVSAGANGVVGAGAGAASYLHQNGWRINSGWDFAGKIAGGGFAGAVGGLAGPAGGSLARGMSLSSTGMVARAGTMAISGAGAGTGSMLENVIAGDPIDPVKAGATGLFGAGAAAIPVGRIPAFNQTGVSTLRQMPYFARRTANGMFNYNQTNTVGLWGGAFGGGSVGFGGDQLQSALGW
ncbi:hypothetical protein [Arthrobacter sp. U41]|uniref:hypothetical protein n=1 Tax=Arthrobacter sp. U41 TaxID=1849032 RepID=UPI00164328E5|nr:hypothetical protein [Arthrobacter sp. U41]